MSDAPATSGDAPTPTPACTVSVRALCEFTARQGDLDRRYTPSATALEGQMGQAAVTARRGDDYETEIALQAVQGALHVRGRADGYDPGRGCLEEIKTVIGGIDDVSPARQRLHWAQLQTYGAMFCRERGLQTLGLALVYFDLESQTESELVELCAAEDLEAAFVARCQGYEAWALQEQAHRRARDAALRTLPFPPGRMRPGQRPLARAVHDAVNAGRCLQAEAPTGIGKTYGTLYPTLRAMPAQALDKLLYLTCKGTGRLTALQALHALREAAAGRTLRVLVLVAKEQACEHPDKPCHGEACPLARGFFDRLPQAREQAVAEGWMDAPAVRRVALTHGICPYYLGQDLQRWADVLVGDVHHLFDPNGQVWALSRALEWRLAALIDEAHNLVDRARDMYSASLSLAALHAAMARAPKALQPRLQAVAAELRALGSPIGPGQTEALLETLPDAFTEALQDLAGALARHFRRLPLAVGPLLDFHFEIQHCAERVEALGSHTLCQVEGRHAAADGGTGAPPGASGASGALGASSALTAVQPADLTLHLHNVVPAPFLRPRLQALHGAVLFSATLGPARYQADLLGLPEGTQRLDVPPVFPPEHLQVRVAHRLSTRYAHRQRTLPALAALMARQYDAQPGNYLAFFSSHDYLRQAADALAQRRPALAQWRQARQMGAAEREAFLARFTLDSRGIGFAVLGGVFAEGVDLPGARLIGVFVATLALPPVSALQDRMHERLESMFGAGCGYADRVPAMQKVVQAAGRVLRTPEDRGWLWLMDERYATPEVAQLLPAWWGVGPRVHPTTDVSEAGAARGDAPQGSQPARPAADSRSAPQSGAVDGPGAGPRSA
ncbi:MAG: ATP-dependent DNA helicase [Rubrivivax sp.]